MTSRPSTTLKRCRGAEKRLSSRHTYGRSTNCTRIYVEIVGMEQACPGVLQDSISIYVTIPRFTSSIDWKFIKCGRRIPWDLKKKLTPILKVKTSLKPFFEEEKCFIWVDFLFSRDSRVDNQNRSAEPQGHQIRSLGTKSILSNHLKDTITKNMSLVLAWKQMTWKFLERRFF